MWGKRVQSEVSNLGDDVEVISLTGRERESHRERIEVFFLGGGDALWGARPLVFVQGSLQLRLLEGTVRQPVWLYSLLDHVCKRGDVWRHQKPDKTF